MLSFARFVVLRTAVFAAANEPKQMVVIPGAGQIAG